jgi:epoxyqueuosine reductase
MALRQMTMSLGLALKEKALALGFDLVGVAPPAAWKELEFCRDWLEKGYGGEMQYLANPKRNDLRVVLPSVKSVVCVGLIYNTPHHYSTDVCDCSVGRENSPVPGATPPEVRSSAWISRYAWGKDYHEVIRRKLEGLRTVLETLAPGVETRVYVDTGPIVERAFARLAGLGWTGKNTCLINESKGSWFFLGVILTNLQLQSDLPAPDRCGSCTRCLDACPTGALVEPYVMDASRCISYFNIELKGSIPGPFRKAMGSNVFGCDICQDVCPWNDRPLAALQGPLHNDSVNDQRSSAVFPPRRAATTSLPEFQPLQADIPSHGRHSERTKEEGAASSPAAKEPLSLFNPPLERLASLTEEDFRRVFAQSPIKRVKYRGWLRNLCVAVGNSGNRRFIPWLEEMARNPDAMVREHADWALRQLQNVESKQ